MKKLFIGVVALGLSPLAFANGTTYAATPLAPAFNPSVYVGIQPGYGLTGWNNFEGLDDLIGNPAFSSPSIFKVKNHDGFAGRVYVGYDFHPNFAVEFGYTNWFTKPKLQVYGYDAMKASSDPWALDLVGKIKAPVPGVENLGLYAKAGVGYLNSKLKVIDVDDSGFKNSDGSSLGGDAFNVVYGVGATYDITRNIATGLSWTRYNGHKKLDSKYIPDMDLFAVDLCYKFFF